MVFSFLDLTMGGVPDNLSSNNGFESFEAGTKGKQTTFHGGEDWGENEGLDSLILNYEVYQDQFLQEDLEISKSLPEEQQQILYTDYVVLDGVSPKATSPPIQTCLEEIPKLEQKTNGILQDVAAETKKEIKGHPLAPSSLGLLNNYGSGFKRLQGKRKFEGVKDIKVLENNADRKLSTEEILRVAGEMFVQFSCQIMIDSFISMLDRPFNPSFSGLSDQEKRDVKLVVILLAAAEKVGCQQYDHASRLLKQCDYISLKTGNPVQRVVYYFAEALHEKIETETGSVSSKGSRRKPVFDIDDAMMKTNRTVMACQLDLPFCQITRFTGMQAIIGNVAKAKRIHIIDLFIRNGVQWTSLLQDLASRYDTIELLKITAVTTGKKHLTENTGNGLSSFAQSLGLPFTFKIVMVSDMLDLKEDLFELDAEETVVVFAGYAFRNLLAMPNRIENIMNVIKVIKPSLMVVTEVEANHNSPIFVNRFIEVLFFFSAYFDCVAFCMKHDCKNREIMESVYFAEAIRNMVATEGDERKVRHVKFDVWRTFFARYGMKEANLSRSCLYQANLLLKTFACGSSCTISRNGKSLLVGWKGTPMLSISVWKFL